jgi:transcriptional regulator with XRE-family HTH domain
MPTSAPRLRRTARGLWLLIGTLGWSTAHAARELGISDSMLIQMRSGQRTPGIDTIDQVCDALRAHGMQPDPDALFPRDPIPTNGHAGAADAE